MKKIDKKLLIYLSTQKPKNENNIQSDSKPSK